MIICVCNALGENECRETARQDTCRSVGCVYRCLGGRVQCGRCVPYMREIFEEAKANEREDEKAGALPERVSA